MTMATNGGIAMIRVRKPSMMNNEHPISMHIMMIAVVIFVMPNTPGKSVIASSK
jgi:hypothetical protein